MRATSRWLRTALGQQVFYLAGPAGTGKTTLAKYLVEQEAPGRWLYAAFTGKAAHVLRQKGCQDARTIHSLIYRPAGETLAHEIAVVDLRLCQLKEELRERLPTEEESAKIAMLEKLLLDLTTESEKRWRIWAASPLADPCIDGVVVDECSMIDADIARDLESFGKKILVLGDPFQLPPVRGTGHYTNRRPDMMLTEVHRQAQDSRILRLATLIREGGDVWSADRGADLALVPRERAQLAIMSRDHDQTLVGTNETRRNLNRAIRTLLGRAGDEPEIDDRVVCLRNDRSAGLFNGSQWRVTKVNYCDVDGMVADLDLKSEDGDGSVSDVETWLHHMFYRGDELPWEDKGSYQEFDWSYAMTTHKAQGSQWPSVLVYDQSRVFRADAKRWLYTAVTRAAKSLTVVL